MCVEREHPVCRTHLVKLLKEAAGAEVVFRATEEDQSVKKKIKKQVPGRNDGQK